MKKYKIFVTKTYYKGTQEYLNRGLVGRVKGKIWGSYRYTILSL